MPTTSYLNYDSQSVNSTTFAGINSWNTTKTAAYFRTLRVTKTIATTSPNIYLALPAYDTTTPLPSGVTTQRISAVTFYGRQANAGQALPSNYQQVSPYASDNKISGVSFFSFVNKGTFPIIENIALNLGPQGNPGKSAAEDPDNTDGSDTILIGGGKKAGQEVNLNNVTLTTGSANSLSLDGDLVAFGIAPDPTGGGTMDSARYVATSGATPSLGFQTTIRFIGGGSTAFTSTRFANSILNTGNGPDTVVFAGPSGQFLNDTFNLNSGADLFYVQQPSIIFGGNVIDLGVDIDKDSVVFGGTTFSSTTFSNINSTLAPASARFLAIKNFTFGTDSFIVGGKNYTSQAQVTTDFGTQIRFI